MKLMLLVLLAQAVEVPKVPVLLLPHEYHGEEVTAKDGERWMGLVKEGKGFRWKDVRLRVQLIHDLILDEEGEKTGKDVSVVGVKPVMMVPLSLGLGKARVKAVPMPTDASQGLGKPPIRLECGGCKAALELRWEGTETDLHIVVRRGGVEQEIARIENPNDSEGGLIWAGDLDGDGQIDLVFDTSNHYNVSKPTLFLSSRAGKGQIVKKVAAHRSVGC